MGSRRRGAGRAAEILDYVDGATAGGCQTVELPPARRLPLVEPSGPTGRPDAHEAELRALRDVLARQLEMLEWHERDRQLIGFEIHDGLAQQLVAAAMHFEAVRATLKPSRSTAAGFDAAMRILRDAAAEARRLIGGLRPPVLEERGLVAAVDELIAQVQEGGGPDVLLAVEGQIDRLPPPLEGNAFRIIQESLWNVRRHSGSPAARVRLTATGATLTLQIRDWGRGFDKAKVAPQRFGLKGIRERARLFGGRAVIRTTPGKGTEVRVVLPLRKRRKRG